MRLWIPIVLAAALVDCSSSKNRPARTAEWTVNLSNQSEYSRVIVSADGRDLTPERLEGRSTYFKAFKAPLRAHADGTAIEPLFSARVQTSCGWREAGLEVQRAPDPSVMTVSLYLFGAPARKNAMFWVDNRSRPETRLRVNAEERMIATGQAMHFRVAYELCAAAREVSVDGKVVGILPEKMPQGKGGGLDYYNPREVHAFLLLDTSGTRCYVYTEHCYANKGFSNVCGGPQTHVYRAKHVHQVPREINFFFTPAPKQTTVATDAGTATQVSLKDCGAN